MCVRVAAPNDSATYLTINWTVVSLKITHCALRISFVIIIIIIIVNVNMDDNQIYPSNRISIYKGTTQPIQ